MDTIAIIAILCVTGTATVSMIMIYLGNLRHLERRIENIERYMNIRSLDDMEEEEGNRPASWYERKKMSDHERERRLAEDEVLWA